MATIVQDRKDSGVGGLGCLFVLAVLIAVVVIVAVGLPTMNDHATERHGIEANEAWRHINSLGNRNFCKWRCADGRDRFVCFMGGNKWAVAVVEGNNLITAFVSSQDYAKSIIDSAHCKNKYHFAHP